VLYKNSIIILTAIACLFFGIAAFSWMNSEGQSEDEKIGILIPISFGLIAFTIDGLLFPGLAVYKIWM
jgi:nitrogen fixation-related uncharacterized protein